MESSSRLLKQQTGHMKLLSRMLPLILILTGAIVLFEQPAYGYTDPGTGLLAVQAMGSALVAAGWYLRKKIYSLFHRNRPSKQEKAALAAEDSEGSSLQ
jgi:O-antigen/teichoic acid export membrane protein